jgi:pimeloyl-ACP methyl ester carboxylesterase
MPNSSSNLRRKPYHYDSGPPVRGGDCSEYTASIASIRHEVGMNIFHRWFRSGAYSLMGHIDLPETTHERLGAVIVPPFGWEDVCCYRPLRFLGQTLAASGLPCLRYDLPGTADSSGSATDPKLLDAWIRSVDDAAAELRAATGVENVAVVGVRLGAMLAVAAADRGANVQDLVLWGPAATGRSMLSEWRAARMMEQFLLSKDRGSGNSAPRKPMPGLEAFGFLLTPETQAELESLDLSALQHMQRRRILIASRDSHPVDNKLIVGLQALGCDVEVIIGAGYTAMMEEPHDAAPPVDTSKVIVKFLTDNLQKERNGNARKAHLPTPAPDQPVAAAIEYGRAKVFETISTIEFSTGSIFGVLSEPDPQAPRTDLCVLFLNPGAVRHIGSNRMWVEASRRWAVQGVPCLRMDFVGLGESTGELLQNAAGLHHTDLVDQIGIAIELLRSRIGARRFAVVGLCSGAFAGFQAIVRNPDIRAAILLNPRLFFWDPEVERRRILRRTINGVTSTTAWSRLARGKITPQRMLQGARVVLDRLRTGAESDRQLQIPPEAMAHSRAAIERNQSRVTLIFTEGEPLLLEMEEEGHLQPESNSRIRCERIPNAGHTFRPLWAQLLVHELIDRDIRAVLRESRPILTDAAKSREVNL